MTAVEMVQLALGITGLIGAVAAVGRFFGRWFKKQIKWLVTEYLAELKPNSGSSLKDSVVRLESQMELVVKMLTDK